MPQGGLRAQGAIVGVAPVVSRGPQRAHLEALKHPVQTAHVVGVRMRQGDEVEVEDPRGAQERLDDSRPRIERAVVGAPSVDEQGATPRQLDDRALAAGGIDPGAVRFSIGLEDAEDLISDAYVALESLSRP